MNWIKSQPPKHTYAPDTAERVMVPKDKVPVVPTGTTLARARELVAAKTREYESVDYIYVVDREGHLRGVFSIKEILASQEEEKHVDDIMQRNIITVRPHTHQERVGLLALQHNIKSLPVVDKDGIFLGIIPADAILKILDQEAVEDFLRLGGIYYKGPYDDLLRLPVLKSIKHRLPWLLLGLLGGIFAAGVVSSFEETLSRNLILAAFIPLIVYMADAVGTQMEAFIIRDLAINPQFRFSTYFVKQVSVAGILGVSTSFLLVAVSFFLYGNIMISLVLGVALFFAILSSVFSGLIIPYLFGKLKLDPANAAGPVATIIQDVVSVSIFLFIASRIL